MPGTPAIDLVHLARQTAGDRDLEQELLAMFADQCVKHLATIRAAGADAGRDAAHTLKGAARAIGAWSVAEAAAEVEQSLATGATARLEALADAAEHARAAIAAMRAAA
jgi:HPt (histidine-containing phosphotransfer) domain-containing protein